MKKYVISLMLLTMALTTAAQETQEPEDKLEATVATDIVSQYIWRGQDLGHVSFQPTLGIAYKGLSLTAWGSVGLTDSHDTKEIDLTLAYNIGGLNIGVTDYWTTDGQDPDNRYFKYDAHGTNHVFEANIGYDFGPLSLQWFTNFAGNDGVNKDEKRAYSSYLELSAPFRLAKLDWTGTVGIVPWRTTCYDTNGFACTNVSLRAKKDFIIKEKYHLPVYADLISNPCSGKFYFVFGTGFSI